MSVSKYFKEENYLKSVLKNYIVRESQIDMANIISDSLKNYHNSLIEAPTGSGKTMAYLIPSIDSNDKIIISTKTIQLMNQLIERDIPTVLNALNKNKNIVQLKGRKNYFCPLRYNKYILRNQLMYPDIVEWFNEYMSVHKDYPFLIPYGMFKDGRELMTADSYQCTGSKCMYIGNCPFERQKNIANEADIIITNHFMLLSDISSKSKMIINEKRKPKGIFDKRDHIIFDEAHSLPDIFSVYAGVDLSLYSILIMFFENKTFFSVEDVRKVVALYQEISNHITEGKALVDDTLYSKINDFMDFTSNLIVELDDEDVTNVYAKYYQLYDEYKSPIDGIRYVEKVMLQNNHNTSKESIRYVVNMKLEPYDISHNFKTGLDASAESSVFISATLSTKGNFKYFINELGIDDDISTHVMPTVFNLKEQGKLYLPLKPGEDVSDRRKDQFLLDFLNNMPGSAILICNSNDRMEQVYRLLSSSNIKKKVFLQTNINIGTLDFNIGDMVLVGSATLREGIDISEGYFSAVILDKLPFEYYKDLILEKKADNIKANGGNPFMDFFLPRAVLYFKQAIGRLIRHEGDSGLWIVLDEKLLDPSKRYKGEFLNVLKNVEIIQTKKEALDFLTKGGN